MSQLMLEGKTKTEVAIDRLRFHEPPEGYYGAFSGGKDSVTIHELSHLAGVKTDWHYNQTGIDPPELVQFIRQHYPNVDRHIQHPSIWQLIEKKGLPRRQARWCCELLKENSGSGRIVLTGVRWVESPRRRARRLFEVCHRDATKRYLNPIIDWTTAEVWAFIREHKLPYCSLYDEGFARLGCVMCPMQGLYQLGIERRRWPKLAEAWRRAAIRYWERNTVGGQKFRSGNEFFEWWITRRGRKNKAQCMMLE